MMAMGPGIPKAERLSLTDEQRRAAFAETVERNSNWLYEAALKSDCDPKEAEYRMGWVRNALEELKR
ncbi:MAG: hypothetical protein H6868_03335 [Rhodospirillales bacterium]|nr:hypothetical protein [Rhodospirillales bacterium]